MIRKLTLCLILTLILMSGCAGQAGSDSSSGPGPGNGTNSNNTSEVDPGSSSGDSSVETLAADTSAGPPSTVPVDISGIDPASLGREKMSCADAVDSGLTESYPYAPKKDGVKRLDEIAHMLTDSAKGKYDGFCLASADAKGLTMTIYQRGFVDDALTSAASGSGNWDTMVEEFRELNEKAKDVIDSCGQTETSIVLNIQNDQQTDKVVLIYINDELMYDAISEAVA